MRMHCHSLLWVLIKRSGFVPHSLGIPGGHSSYTPGEFERIWTLPNFETKIQYAMYKFQRLV